MSMFFNPFKRKTPTPINLSLDQIDKARREFMTDYEKQPFKLSDSFPKALTRLSPAPLNENKIAEEAYKSKFGSYRNSQIEKAGLASRLVDKLSTKLAGHKGDVLIIAQKEGDEEPEATLPRGIKAEDLLEQIEEVYREAQLDPHAGPRSGSYEKLQSRLKENNLQIHSNNAEPSLSFITALLQHASGEYQKPEGGPNTAQNDKTHHADARTIKTAVDEARAAAEAPPAAQPAAQQVPQPAAQQVPQPAAQQVPQPAAQPPGPADNTPIVRNLNDLSMFEALKMVEELYQDVALTVQIVVPVKKGIGEDPSVPLLKHVSTLQSLNTTSETEGEKRKKVTVTLLKRDGQFFPISEMGNLFSPDRHPQARRDAKKGFLRKYTSDWATKWNPHRADARELTDHLLEKKWKDSAIIGRERTAVNKEYKKRTSTGKINEKDGLLFGILRRAKKLKERSIIENLKAESNLKGLENLFGNCIITAKAFETEFKAIIRGTPAHDAAPDQENALPLTPEQQNALLCVLERARHDDRISKSKKRLISKSIQELKLVKPVTYEAAVAHPIATTKDQNDLINKISNLHQSFDSPAYEKNKISTENASALINRAFSRNSKTDLEEVCVLLARLKDSLSGVKINQENIPDKINNIIVDIDKQLILSDLVPTSEPLMHKYNVQIFEHYLSTVIDARMRHNPDKIDWEEVDRFQNSITKYKNFDAIDENRNLCKYVRDIEATIARIEGTTDSGQNNNSDVILDTNIFSQLNEKIDRIEKAFNGISPCYGNRTPENPTIKTLQSHIRNLRKSLGYAVEIRNNINNFESFKPFNVQRERLPEADISNFLLQFGPPDAPTFETAIPLQSGNIDAPSLTAVRQAAGIFSNSMDASNDASSDAFYQTVLLAKAIAAKSIARTKAEQAQIAIGTNPFDTDRAVAAQATRQLQTATTTAQDQLALASNAMVRARDASGSSDPAVSSSVAIQLLHAIARIGADAERAAATLDTTAVYTITRLEANRHNIAAAGLDGDESTRIAAAALAAAKAAKTAAENAKIAGEEASKALIVAQLETNDRDVGTAAGYEAARARYAAAAARSARDSAIAAANAASLAADRNNGASVETNLIIANAHAVVSETARVAAENAANQAAIHVNGPVLRAP